MLFLQLGDQGWNDEDGHGEGQLHMDHGEINNSARGRRIFIFTVYLFGS